MRRYFKNINLGFRFTRWSRHAYGAFSSLHREVTIGRVCNEIVEAAMVKQGSLSGTGNTSVPLIGSFEDEDTSQDDKLTEILGGESLLNAVIQLLTQSRKNEHQPRPRLEKDLKYKPYIIYGCGEQPMEAYLCPCANNAGARFIMP